MASDDFDVIVYKVLAYAYGCMKAGREVDIDKAWELAGCPPEAYWKAVLSSMQKDGLVEIQDARYDILGNVMVPGKCAVTLEGAIFVRDNSKMAKAKSFLGKAFEKALSVAVAAAPIAQM